MIRSLLSAIALAGLAAAPATAHIAIAESQGAPGAYHVASLRVGHGCDGAATTAVRVEIPALVASAKPQPKPGWTVAAEREPGGRVVAVVWRGRLPDEQFELFPLLVKLPQAAGALYFPTVQTCERGENRWIEIPAAGAAWTSVLHPAPMMTVGSSEPAPAVHRH